MSKGTHSKPRCHECGHPRGQRIIGTRGASDKNRDGGNGAPDKRACGCGCHS